MSNPNQRFHRTDDEFRAQCEKTIHKHLEMGNINQDDARLIESWVSELRATHGISCVRSAKLTCIITGTRRWIDVPFKEMNTGDLFRAIDKINSDTNFKHNSKADISRTLKRFSAWLCESGYSSPGLQVEKVRKIRALSYQTTKDESVLFTPTEIRAFIDAAKSPRDKAIIATCYEGGLRIGEIGNMRWRDLQIHDWNISLKVDFKTGKARHVPLVFAMPYLKEWFNHCEDMSPDGFVFTTRTGDPLQYNGVVKMMRRSLESAGIEKHFTPHMLRHSRITHLIAERDPERRLPESVIKMMMWGDVETDQFRTYLHLVDDDTDQAIAQLYGVKKAGRKPRDAALDPLQCPKCAHINPPGGRFCSQCGAALTMDAVSDVNKLTSDLIDLITYSNGQELINKVKASSQKEIPEKTT